MKDQTELRSIQLHRVPSKQAVTPQEARLYSPSTGGVNDTIKNLSEALKGSFDILVLHDDKEGCLVVNLEQNITAELPCKIHPKK